jgi:RimJ/RimL family protein N-acetyltransferase
VLRLATHDDLPALIALAQRPEVARTLATNTLDQLPASLESETGELLAIELDGALVGGVRWETVVVRARIAEVRALMLDPAVQRRGVAVAAVRALAQHLFTEHDMHRVEAEVLGFNEGGQRVFDRAGFVREGIRRQSFHRRGRWQDVVRYGLLPEDPV